LCFRVFRSRTPPDAIDLISKVLVYPPHERLIPLEVLQHAFFDELRDIKTRLPNGNPLPDLFNFTKGKNNKSL
jgi:glycogen synthase kinase 3 beta